MSWYPRWLYFDSKLTTYDELSQITKMKDVSFVTIRRRGISIIRRLENMPASTWTSAVIDIPKRRSHNPILREAILDKDHPKIPWLGNHKLEFVYS